MKSENISRLLSAFNSGTQAQTTKSKSLGGEAKTADQSDAVVVSQNFEGDGDARAARVAQLKEQVANGSYKPSSIAVAESVARDLFA